MNNSYVIIQPIPALQISGAKLRSSNVLSFGLKIIAIRAMVDDTDQTILVLTRSYDRAGQPSSHRVGTVQKAHLHPTTKMMRLTLYNSMQRNTFKAIIHEAILRIELQGHWSVVREERRIVYSPL